VRFAPRPAAHPDQNRRTARGSAHTADPPTGLCEPATNQPVCPNSPDCKKLLSCAPRTMVYINRAAPGMQLSGFFLENVLQTKAADHRPCGGRQEGAERRRRCDPGVRRRPNFLSGSHRAFGAPRDATGAVAIASGKGPQACLEVDGRTRQAGQPTFVRAALARKGCHALFPFWRVSTRWNLEPVGRAGAAPRLATRPDLRHIGRLCCPCSSPRESF